MKIDWPDIVLKVISYLTLATLLVAANALLLLWLMWEVKPSSSWSFRPSSILIVLGLTSCCLSLFVLKLDRKYLVALTVVGAVILLHFLIAEVAKDTVRLIARNVTDSIPAGYHDSIVWDDALRRATYVTYAAVLLTQVIFSHIVLMKKTTTKVTRRILAGLFVLSFPTIANWKIATACGGFGGYCQRPLEIVTPIILSLSPIHVGISALCVTLLLAVYGKLAKVEFI